MCETVFPSFSWPRPNYGRNDGDNGDLFQNCLCQDCCIQCPQPYGRPLLINASARDSWTLTGKSGSVFCEVTAPFSWVLVHTRLFFFVCVCVCALQESVSPILWTFCNQIPLVFKFPGNSQSLWQIPRLGNLLWALELSQQF